MLFLMGKKKPGEAAVLTLPSASDGQKPALGLSIPGVTTPTAVTTPAAVTSPGFVPTPSTPVTAVSQAEKAQGYQQEVIEALKQLGVDSEGNIKTVPSEAAIHYASGLVTRMKNDGFVAESQALDQLVQKAIKMLPAANIVTLPGIPAALAAEVNNAIAYSKDPKKLRALADALLKLPGASSDPNIKNTIEMVTQLAAQLEAQQVIANGVQQAEQILNQLGAPNVVIPNVPVTTTSTPVAVPEAAAPKSNVEIAADLMVAHLKRVQLQAGSVTAAKGKEDKNTVKKFQTLAKLTSDGKPGPGTLVAAASFGQFELPLVMYWPTSATKQKVYDYRAALLAIAAKLDSTNPSGAKQLRESAARERGQAGIVGGPLPA